MGLLTVVVHIIVAKNHINVLAVLVLDKQVRQGGAVRNELRGSAKSDSSHHASGAYLCLDARRRDGVPPVLVRSRSLRTTGHHRCLCRGCHGE